MRIELRENPTNRNKWLRIVRDFFFLSTFRKTFAREENYFKKILKEKKFPDFSFRNYSFFFLLFFTFFEKEKMCEFSLHFQPLETTLDLWNLMNIFSDFSDCFTLRAFKLGTINKSDKKTFQIRKFFIKQTSKSFLKFLFVFILTLRKQCHTNFHCWFFHVQRKFQPKIST